MQRNHEHPANKIGQPTLVTHQHREGSKGIETKKEEEKSRGRVDIVERERVRPGHHFRKGNYCPLGVVVVHVQCSHLSDTSEINTLIKKMKGKKKELEKVIEKK